MPRRRHRRARILVVVVLLVMVGGVALAVLSRPLMAAKREADQAQSDLKLAKTELAQQHLAKARAHVADARRHVDAAHRDAHGFGADVWSVVPVAGGAVDDARHLVDALDETTTVADIGARTYPMVSGPNSHLVNGRRIDLKVLQKVADQTAQLGTHLDKAMSDVNQVKGSTPIVGGAVSRARDSALGYLQPVQDSYDKAGPLVQSLPSIVGADGPRTYLLAMLNPAELRYSGGGALSFTTMHFEDGKATFGTSVNVDDLLQQGAYQHWTPVRGNPFHKPGPMRVANSTFSPWWSVSGEELLRGYQATYPGQKLDGVIGLDLQSLADVFKITGPVDLPHFGTITSDNLIKTLAGSYGDFSSIDVRHQMNAELVPAFRQKFFEGGRMADKLGAIVSSGNGRHFFTYFNDREIQSRFAAAGLSGDLSDTDNDYIGVFTQNLNGSKTDYWQHRDVTSAVDLHADGTAAVHLKVDVANLAPPYTLSTPDPKSGYNTRYLGTIIGIFLPNYALLGPVTADGAPYTPNVHRPKVHTVHNRKYFGYSTLLPQNATAHVEAAYTVPAAAEVTSPSTMIYRLDIDPQPLVNPESVAVSVTFPDGWTATSLPAGWKATAHGAAWKGPVPTKLHFEIPLDKTAGS